MDVFTSDFNHSKVIEIKCTVSLTIKIDYTKLDKSVLITYLFYILLLGKTFLTICAFCWGVPFLWPKTVIPLRFVNLHFRTITFPSREISIMLLDKI